MPGAPTLIVFLGGFGSSEVERLVDSARTAASFDAIDAWGSNAIIVTDDPELRANTARVLIDHDTGDFHFGRRLAGVIQRHNIERAVYIGGGSVPLFGPNDFAGVAARVTDAVAVTNNLYSSDLIAFPVNDRVLATIESVGRDNSLARALKDDAGLEVQSLERTVATQFDIDTPTDVCVLALTGEGGARLQAQLASLDLDVERYRAVLPLFLDTTKQIVVAGRVGTHSWSYLERETACRVRLFAEERGMEADGRAASGAARSLLGYYLDAVGLERFFETLGELGDAAFIDTRVLLAHKRIEASREDRFLSDLGRWEGIGEPFLRDFTRAAVEAPMPVLLGGHSLMAGGLMALNEYAWRTLGDD
jgi:2-phospho-L-lactate guanylyltransferase (CobY/MobA/RfbA family)